LNAIEKIDSIDSYSMNLLIDYLTNRALERWPSGLTRARSNHEIHVEKLTVQHEMPG